jgi:hypothetical protein
MGFLLVGGLEKLPRLRDAGAGLSTGYRHSFLHSAFPRRPIRRLAEEIARALAFAVTVAMSLARVAASLTVAAMDAAPVAAMPALVATVSVIGPVVLADAMVFAMGLVSVMAVHDYHATIAMRFHHLDPADDPHVAMAMLGIALDNHHFFGRLAAGFIAYNDALLHVVAVAIPGFPGFADGDMAVGKADGHLGMAVGVVAFGLGRNRAQQGGRQAETGQGPESLPGSGSPRQREGLEGITHNNLLEWGKFPKIGVKQFPGQLYDLEIP